MKIAVFVILLINFHAHGAWQESDFFNGKEKKILKKASCEDFIFRQHIERVRLGAQKRLNYFFKKEVEQVKMTLPKLTSQSIPWPDYGEYIEQWDVD